MRTQLAEYDLASPSSVESRAGYDRLRVTVRWGRRPLGTLFLTVHSYPDTPRSFSRGVLTREVERQLEILSARQSDYVGNLPASPATTPAISVVVCTRDRPQSLQRCLASLQRLDYPTYEVVVVDNSSSPTACDRDETGVLPASIPVRLIREKRPGLNRARNRGADESRFDIVAYIDDDAVADPFWLPGLADGFADPETLAVTGLVLPLELETRAQHLFERYGNGMSKGMAPKMFDARTMSARQLLAAQDIGVGTNMAFRRVALERLGGFDGALDLGTPAAGAGDLDMLHRVLMSGGRIRYEPSALVWHRHRASLQELERQVYNNGRSYGVYLMKRWREGNISRSEVASFATLNWTPWLLGRFLLGLFGRHVLPRRVLAAELWGAMHSPLAYFMTRRSNRAHDTTEGSL